jgi:hypothetical protein
MLRRTRIYTQMELLAIEMDKRKLANELLLADNEKYEKVYVKYKQKVEEYKQKMEEYNKYKQKNGLNNEKLLLVLVRL